MAIESAYDWQRFYAAERGRLGERWLDQLLDEADERFTSAPWRADAVVVPHTRLEITGSQIADAATAIVHAGYERVLALGVVHGGRRADAELVAAARAGSCDALAAVRGVHTADGLAAEEFSLDAFAVVLARAAHLAGRDVQLVARYPFLAGLDPASLHGFDELRELTDDGAALVATADPIHHGHAYGTAPAACRDPADRATLDSAHAAITRQLELLAVHDFAGFAEQVTGDRSDFRDTGPVLATLLGTNWRATITDLALVDYSTALDAPSPTWVAGALVRVDAPPA